MKQLQKLSKFLSDYTSIVVIAIAVITFFLPSLMGWVNFQLFTDPAANKFTSQSIIIGIIMFSMGLTLTTEDFKILAQRPFDICIGAIAQYLIMPFFSIWNYKSIKSSRWNRTWTNPCRMLSRRCIIQHYVLPLWWRRCIFCRNDNSINNTFTSHDTTYGIILGKRSKNHNQRTANVRIYY